MATPREGLYTAIQTAKIYIRSLNSLIADIALVLLVGSKLRYNAQPTFNDPEDIPSIRWVSGMLNNVSIAVGVIPFSTGDAALVRIPSAGSWNTSFQNLYGNGRFWVMYKNADGTISDMVAIPATRTKDGTNTFQDFVTLDFGAAIAQDGQIIIENSQVPLP